MAAANLNKLFFSFFLLLLCYLGCFLLTSHSRKKDTDDVNYPRRKRKSPHNHNLPLSLSSSWSFLKQGFKRRARKETIQYCTTSFSSPRSSHHTVLTPILDNNPPPDRKRRSASRSEFTEYSVLGNPILPLNNEIIPCSDCGEIFQNGSLLEHHQSTKHAVSELRDGDSGKNVVVIIFKTGWDESGTNPNIQRILKIHNSPKILSRFEEYREKVKAMAGYAPSRDERCLADGNELLRFHCTTLVCDLGQNGHSSICNNYCCSACGIIRAGFSAKLDGISTVSSSWRAHLSIPDDMEAEFGFMNVKRAMLVCRVIAGRVGFQDPMVVDKEYPGFDSLLGSTESDHQLLVFNPTAVLPCFLIVYSLS